MVKFDQTRLSDIDTIRINEYKLLNLTRLLDRQGPTDMIFFVLD